MKDDLKEAEAFLSKLADMAPDHVDPVLKNLPTQTRFHAVCLRGVLSHRIKDLGLKAITLYKSDQLVPAFLVTRAIMETVALLYYLHKKLRSAIQSKETKKLNDWLVNVIFGSRNKDTEMKSPNTLTALDRMGKEHLGVRVMYDQLSEFCHPNYSGVLASYSHLNHDKSVLLLGPDPDPPMTLGSIPLSLSLENACHYYEQIQLDLDELRETHN